MFDFYFYSFWREVLSFFPESIIFVQWPIPYFSQFASRELAEKIITGEMPAEKDPHWRQSGARTVKEYALWCRNMCGMACLQMILVYQREQFAPIIDLAKACVNYGGYVIRGDFIDGLFYKPFCRYVKEKWKLRAFLAPFLSLRRIRFELGEGNLVMASVHPGIRVLQKQDGAINGGHLVLITGFDLAKKTFFLHNPSGFMENIQEHFVINEEDFKTFFAWRGIVISRN